MCLIRFILLLSVFRIFVSFISTLPARFKHFSGHCVFHPCIAIQLFSMIIKIAGYAVVGQRI